MKYTLDYATRMPTREKNKLSHGITSMEYGLIFHVTRIGKYYCKNMKYRINIYIYMYMVVSVCMYVSNTHADVRMSVCY